MGLISSYTALVELVAIKALLVHAEMVVMPVPLVTVAELVTQAPQAIQETQDLMVLLAMAVAVAVLVILVMQVLLETLALMVELAQEGLAVQRVVRETPGKLSE
jgi:hypothetical protein